MIRMMRMSASRDGSGPMTGAIDGLIPQQVARYWRPARSRFRQQLNVAFGIIENSKKSGGQMDVICTGIC